MEIFKFVILNPKIQTVMKKLIFIFSWVLLGSFSVNAQIQQAFFMDNTPVSRTYNIAMKPAWGFYIGLPVSDINFGVNTTGANFGDLFFKENGDYTSIFDDNISDARKQQFLNDISNDVQMGTDIRFTPFSLGFGNGKNTFGLSFSQRIDLQMNMPKELFEIILFGTDEVAGGTDLSGTSLSINTFSEMAFTYRRQITESLAIAIRPKLLSGTGYIQFTGNQLVMTPEPDPRLSVNITGESAGAMKLLMEDGKYKEVEFDSEGLGSNLGFGLDLAASYERGKLRLGAGINDIGFIKWSKNAQEFTGDGEIEVDPEGDGGFEGSLEESLNMTSTPAEFTTSLNAVPFMTARYDLTGKISAGALLYGNKIGDKFKPFFTLGANFQPTRWLESSVTYTMREKSFSNLGVALSARLGVIQLYLASDNLLSVISQENANYFNARFGLNFVMGQGRTLRQKHGSDLL
jgi:hypothetical protein